MKLEFSGKIFEIYSNFMKIRPVKGKLFHADGQIHMTKLRVAFRNFANAPISGDCDRFVRQIQTHATFTRGPC